MKKKLISWALVLTLCLSLLPVSALADDYIASGTCGDNLTWTLDNSGTLTISGSGEMDAWIDGDTNVPWDSYRSDIKTVVIDDGVTEIGDYAFQSCTNLTSVTIPDSVTEIGDGAFYSCEALETVNYGGTQSEADAITIGSDNDPLINANWVYAEDNTPITPTNSLSGTLASGLKWLLQDGDDDGAYERLTITGNSAMDDFTQKEVTISEAGTALTTAPWAAYAGDIERVQIEDGVTTIGAYAFYRFANLTSVTIPDSVTTIGEYAFYACDELTNIEFSKNLRTVEAYAFESDDSSSPDITVYYAGTAAYREENLTIEDPNSRLVNWYYGESSGNDVVSQGDVYTVLILDNSSSMTTEAIAAQRSAATQFCNSIQNGDRANYVALVEITSSSNTLVGFTTDMSEVTAGINTIVGYSSTNTAAALVCAQNLFDNEPNSDSAIRNVVLCSDGMPNSESPAYAAADVLKEDGCTIYTLGFFHALNGSSLAAAREFMRKIASSDSYYYDATNSARLNAFFEDIGAEINNVNMTGTCGDNLRWTLSNNSTKLTIKGTGSMYSYTPGKAPWFNPVNNNSFSAYDVSASTIETIVIGDGVTSIGSYAFQNCGALTNVSIPKTIATIGTSAFSGCSSLEKVYYSGSRGEWADVTINSGNEALENATIYYYSTSEADTPEAVVDDITNDGMTKYWDEENRPLKTDSGTINEEVLYSNSTRMELLRMMYALYKDSELASYRVTTYSAYADSGKGNVDDYVSDYDQLTGEEQTYTKELWDADIFNTEVFTEDADGKVRLQEETSGTEVHNIVEDFDKYMNDGRSTQSDASVRQYTLSVEKENKPVSVALVFKAVKEVKDARKSDVQDSNSSGTDNSTVVTPGTGETTAKTYAIKIPANFSGGTVSASPTSAAKGETVTLTVTPWSGYDLDTLKVISAAGKKELEVAIVGYTATFTMPSATVSVQATFKLSDGTPRPASGFSDVPDDSPFSQAVAWAVLNGITTGVTSDTFEPRTTCSNAQILTFLWRSQGEPESEAECPVDDVEEDSPFYTALCWAGELELISEGSNGSDSCTRAMAVTYLWKLAGSPEVEEGTSFDDVAEDAEYAEAVAWAVSEGITKGYADDMFAPDDTCTRGQIVTFLYRAFV